jgi:hypothetical protein
MNSPSDIKPVIQGTVAPAHNSRPVTNTDQKPVIPGDTARSSIDFTKDLDSMQKEHERLDERYHLQKSNLNLQMEVTRMKEENHRLRQERVPAVKAELGLVDIKPDVSRLSREGRSNGTSKDTGMPPIEKNDDHHIVFIRETNDRRPRRTDEERNTSHLPDQRQLSRRLSPQVANPSTPEPTIPLPNVHPEVGLVLVPATPESIPNPDRQQPSEPVRSGLKRPTPIASNHYAKATNLIVALWLIRSRSRIRSRG